MNAVLFALLLVAFLAGCGNNRDAELIGDWKVQLQSIPQVNPDFKEFFGVAYAARMKQSIIDSTLNIRADKTFTWDLEATLKGDWSFDEENRVVSLRVEKLAGRLLDPDKASPSTIYKLDKTNDTFTVQRSNHFAPGIILEKQS